MEFQTVVMGVMKFQLCAMLVKKWFHNVLKACIDARTVRVEAAIWIVN